MIRALLVDDERLARKRLRDLLAAHPEVRILGEASSAAEAVSLCQREKPDVVFLDIHMPRLTGFDLLPELQPLPAIVFVTAHDRYAVRAFEMNAVDYLLKPVRPDRLALTLQRLSPQAPAPPPARTQCLALDDTVILRGDGLMRMALVRHLIAIQAEANYTRVHLQGLPSMVLLRSLGEWARLLPHGPFLRIDRSLMVQLACVSALEIQSRDAAVLTLQGLPLPLTLGRAASARLRRHLKSAGPAAEL